ncbi:hypothetical protein [Gilvimarinus algae]|uniref:Uncharacterized protein n=1 Tax=Gilvimarinus algae TaxID=3058037 RepID=A0ABT8TG88_9GAMM|nr:hypothetical protein [Gilvimarinus sp. SDUM040014]MDO3383107.1 hypothetical protein [Gilvimarinus sp. SDUM040014]
MTTRTHRPGAKSGTNTLAFPLLGLASDSAFPQKNALGEGLLEASEE